MMRFITFWFLLTLFPTCFAQTRQVGSSVSAVFSVEAIPDSIFRLMQGRSYTAGCTIPRSELRYLRLSHFDAEGQEHVGEMVCHRRIAQEVCDIFRTLYQARYPVERMQLIDRYEADDERSMQANNTSCFNYRTVAGTRTLSAHARGMAIDLNPRYNPHVRQSGGKRRVSPCGSEPYADRSKSYPYKIVQGDLAHRLFRQHGFQWGGAWRSSKDYQHFEKK